MICKEEVCMWFKENEPHRRLELICGLLNMCVPLELKFIRTCVEDLSKKDDVLKETSTAKANNSDDLASQLYKIDERTRRKLLIIYIALLEADNQTCSKVLFKSLSEVISTSRELIYNNSVTLEYVKEMLLIYTMVIYHPAFSFEEKRFIGEDLQSLQEVEKRASPSDIWHSSREEIVQNRTSHFGNMPSNSCHPDALISLNHSHIIEQNCDSGLSIGTEPEAEQFSDHTAYYPDQRLVEVGGGVPSSQSSNSDVNLDETFNVGSNYFCGQNVGFNFYPFMGKLSSLPVNPRRAPLAPSETSSSEDNGITVKNNPPPRPRNDSAKGEPTAFSSNSPQSSPYASPPQSLSPSRATSPKLDGEAGATIAPSHYSHSLTSSTSNLMTSQSNQKTTARHNCNNGSHSSSQTITNHTNRSKPLNKSQKSTHERSNPRQRAPPSKEFAKQPPNSAPSLDTTNSDKHLSTSLNKSETESSGNIGASQFSSSEVALPTSSAVLLTSTNNSTEQFKAANCDSKINLKTESSTKSNARKDSIDMVTSGTLSMNSVTSSASIPLYTTPISTTAVVPAVPSAGNYQPYFSYPVMSIGAAAPPYYHPSSSPYPPLMNPGRHPHQSFILSSQGLMQNIPPGPLLKGPHSLRNPPHYTRGGGSNGRSSSSSSSNSSLSSGHGGTGGRKKNSKAATSQNSRSSDSSPSSSQYSSPPQTPSPDHMKDVRPKNGKLDHENIEDLWVESSETNGSSMVHLEEGHPLVKSHPVASNIRQRCMPPYSHFGFVGYQQPHLMRYPLFVGPRGPLASFPNAEKSSREATPPTSIQPVCPPVMPPPPLPSHPDSLKKETPQSMSSPPITSSSPTCSSMPPLSSTNNKMKGNLTASSSPISSPSLDSLVSSLPPTHLPPPPLLPQVATVSASLNSNMHYNINYPMFAVAGPGGGSSHFVTHLPSFMHTTPAPTTPASNYVSPQQPPLTHSFPCTNGNSNGPAMTSELLCTSSNFSLVGPPSSHPTSSSNHLHIPNGPPPPGLHLSQSGIPFAPPYPSSQGGPLNTVPPMPPQPKKSFTCYNCGLVGHKGSDCKEASFHDISKHSVM